MDQSKYQLLDQFKHIQRNLKLLWGSPECRKYLYDLTMSERPGRPGFSQGFPPEQFAAILNLLREHDEEYPMFVPGLNTFEKTNYR